MTNCFAGLDSEELAELLGSFYAKAKEKKAEAGDHDDSHETPEPFRLLAGTVKEASIYANGYDNIIYSFWKSFATTHGGTKQPDPIWRALIPDRDPLAFALQQLSRYCTGKFDYVSLAKSVAMDALFLKGGVGYARHQWDEDKGIATTTRFDPKNVYWEAGAGSTAKAKHVIERHVIPRYDFITKFGKAKGWDADAHGDGGFAWPKSNKRPDGKTLLDKVEYFLCWSKEGGYKRVYAFTKKREDGILNGDDGELGEEWPIDLADDDWHLTPLTFTPINGKIEGASVYWANREQMLSYLSLNSSIYRASLQAGKVFNFFPEELLSEMDAVEKSPRIINNIAYSRSDLQGKIAELVEQWEMPPPPETLLKSREEALNKWRLGVGANASQMVDAQSVQTATEAQTLQSAAQNMLADDQNAVERFQVEVFRKEAFINLSRMPTRSVLCVKTTPQKDGDDPDGEFEDEPDSEDYGAESGEEYLFDVPYEEALLLEKGPESVAAASRIAKSRQAVGDKAAMQAAMNGAQGPDLQQAQEQAQAQVPQTPEMAARAARGIPMDAVVKIVNPGVEQFIGTEAAQGWVEGMSPRQIEAEVGVTVAPGSSSANNKMANVNERLMLLNAVAPILQPLGMYETIEALINSAMKAAEIPDLDTARIQPGQTEQAVQKMQQAQQQQAQAEAQAKAQASQGPTQLNPNDQLKAESEVAKAKIGHATTVEKTKQQELKLQGDQVRERTRSLAQQQQANMPMGGL